MAGSTYLPRTQNLSSYVAVWRRIGEEETFTHKVIACSEEEAITASKAEMRLYLGRNFDLWQIESIVRKLP